MPVACATRTAVRPMTRVVLRSELTGRMYSAAAGGDEDGPVEEETYEVREEDEDEERARSQKNLRAVSLLPTVPEKNASRRATTSSPKDLNLEDSFLSERLRTTTTEKSASMTIQVDTTVVVIG